MKMVEDLGAIMMAGIYAARVNGHASNHDVL